MPRYVRQLNYNDENDDNVSRTTGPVFTIVKTDPQANFKWGVRHYVGRRYH